MIKEIHIPFQVFNVNSIELDASFKVVVVLALENIHVRVFDLNVSGLPSLFVGKFDFKLIIIDILLNFRGLVHNYGLLEGRIASCPHDHHA